MAAAVMTRRNKPHKTRTLVPPIRLNGAALRDSHTLTYRASCENLGDERGKRQRREVTSLVPSISPSTQQSINVVFSFDTRGTDFEESVSQIWPRRCTFVVKELILTERAYVRALGDVIKGYITPLYCYLLSSGDGPGFIQTVFSNIVKIHRCHLELLDDLQSLFSTPKAFAQVFVEKDFSLYTEYCTNYSKGNECLEQSLASSSDLRAFIEDCQTKLVHSLPLHSYLIKPVQRILKYPLLLEELAKNYDDKSAAAYSTIQEAYRRMTEVAEQINSSFHKPVKKHRLTPSAIARIRSKEVEGLQRSRTLTPALVQSSPTQINGYTKRSVSVEPADMESLDKVPLRNHRRRENFTPLKRNRLYRSAEGLNVDSSSEDHLARVRDLKKFFENLSKTDTTVVGTSVTEAAPLMPREWAAFDVQVTSPDEERSGKLQDGRTHVEWPPLRKTGRKLSPEPYLQTSHSETSHQSMHHRTH